jgi:hypothetical protein
MNELIEVGKATYGQASIYRLAQVAEITPQISTIVEKPKKICAVEIAPEYVDVAIRRYLQNFSGMTVTLAATGQTFDAVSAERSSIHG